VNVTAIWLGKSIGYGHFTRLMFVLPLGEFCRCSTLHSSTFAHAWMIIPVDGLPLHSVCCL